MKLITRNGVRCHSVLCLLLVLVTGSAQAFTVTVNSVERSVYYSYGTAGFSFQDKATFVNTGAWADVVECCSYARAELTASNVSGSGTYSVYDLDMTGSLFAINSEPTFVGARTIMNVNFDQDVNLALNCANVGSGFSGTEVYIGFNPVPDIRLACGNNLVLAAGTHAIDFSNFASSNFGGASSLDFDTTLSITAVPIPAAVWLFASGLGLLGWLRRRQVA